MESRSTDRIAGPHAKHNVFSGAPLPYHYVIWHRRVFLSLSIPNIRNAPCWPGKYRLFLITYDTINKLLLSEGKG